VKKLLRRLQVDHGKLKWEKYVEDHEHPFKRKFPAPGLRRKVVVRIDQFPGNPHHHVSIKEECNPVWDEERGDWFDTFWDDGGRGAEFSVKFWKLSNAEAFIKLIWKDWFKPETHRLMCANYEFTESRTSLQRKFDRWTSKVGD